MDITYFDYRLRCLVQFSEEGAEPLVITDGKRSQVERAGEHPPDRARDAGTKGKGEAERAA